MKKRLMFSLMSVLFLLVACGAPAVEEPENPEPETQEAENPAPETPEEETASNLSSDDRDMDLSDGVNTKEEANALVLGSLSRDDRKPVITSIEDKGEAFVVKWEMEDGCETGTYHDVKSEAVIKKIEEQVC